MAPLNLPPSALTLDEAVALEKRMLTDKRFVNKEFHGEELIQFLQTELVDKSPEKIGHALMEHRLLHDVNDEDEFTADKTYRLFSQETPSVRAVYDAQSKLFASSLVQGRIQWKIKRFWGMSTSFVPVYGIMTDKVLTLLKSRSSATTPLAEFAIDSLTEVRECFECKADWYCFTLKRKDDAEPITLCADHSKRMENWIQALATVKIPFTKGEEDDGLEDIHSLFELSARRLNSKDVVPLTEYKDKVCLVVNVSSLCGLTPQYAELEQLHEKYKDEGLRILGFPVNQFANQEPGTEAEIEKFAHEKFDVKFDLFEKTKCNGADAHPVFKYVKGHLGGFMGSSVKWNFTKFLVDRNGVPVKRFAPTTTPLSFEEEIVKLLHEGKQQE